MSVIAEDPKSLQAETRQPSDAAAGRTDSFGGSLVTYLRQRCTAIDEENKNGRVDRIMESMQAWLFYRGKHFQRVDRSLQIRELADTDDLFTINWVASLIDGLATQWETSNPEVKVNPRVQNNSDMVAVARFAEKAADAVRSQNISAWFRQAEAKFATLSRAYFRKTTLERDENLTKKVPSNVRQVKHDLAGTFVCGNMECGMTGIDTYLKDDPATGEKMCQCGSKDLLLMPGDSEEAEEVASYDEVPLLNIKIELVDPTEVTLYPDRCRTVAEADCVSQVRLVKRYRVEDAFPEYQLPDSSLAQIPEGARAQRELETGGANSTTDATTFVGAVAGQTSTSKSSSDEFVLLREYWWKPVMYRRFVPNEDVELCGVKIPGGKPLGLRFRDGIYLAFAGDRLIRIRNVRKDGVWSGAPYKVDPTTFYGKGSEDVIDPQYMLDEMMSMIFGHMMRAASPFILTDPAYLSRGHLLGKEGLVVEIKQNASQSTIGQAGPTALDRAARVLSQGGLDTGAYSLLEVLPKMLQQFTGGFQPLLGGPEVSQKTYSGLALMRDQAVQQLIPALNLRAEEVEAPNVLQILEYIQETWEDEQYAAVAGDFDQGAVAIFRDPSRCNIRRDLMATVKPGSAAPKDRISKLSALETFSQIANPENGAPPNEDLVKYAAELLEMPISVDEKARATHVAAQRWQVMKAAFNEVVLPTGIESDPEGDPNMDAVYWITKDIRRAKVKPLTDDHKAMISYYSEQLDGMADDETIHPTLETILEFRIEQHHFAMALQAQFTKMLETASMGPEVAMQQMLTIAEQSSQFQRQMQQQESSRAQQVQDLETSRAADAETANADAQRQMALKEHGAVVDMATTAHAASLAPQQPQVAPAIS